MLSLLYRLFSSVWPDKRGSLDPPIDLEEEWIALLSDTETKLTENEKSQVDDELAVLRRRDSMKSRAVILGRISETILEHDLTDISSVELPPDLRNKIYKDVFMELSPYWTEEIKKLSPLLIDFERHWAPSMYEKNILGQMIDIADRTGPTKLSATGLAQMIKNVHLSLTQSIVLGRASPLSLKESERLLELLMRSIVPIITLWARTVKYSRNGISRQGRLPTQWKEEDLLLEKKRAGQIDARFKDGDTDAIRQRYINRERIESGLLIDRETLAQRQGALEKRLQFTKRSIEPSNEERMGPLSFRERQSQVRALLQFKL